MLGDRFLSAFNPLKREQPAPLMDANKSDGRGLQDAENRNKEQGMNGHWCKVKDERN
jgi:hypothetical protein